MNTGPVDQDKSLLQLIGRLTDRTVIRATVAPAPFALRFATGSARPLALAGQTGRRG